ncbi:hypothetical protein KGP36_05580 [Patescibacteria group bacterium]|nr:hypothetical protein [Patescibacteria group bacterium]
MASLAPNIFDIARIERILKSINSKVETIESIMVSDEDEDIEIECRAFR